MNAHSRTSFTIVLMTLLLLPLTACISIFTSRDQGLKSDILSNSHLDPVPVNQEIIITSKHEDSDGIKAVDFLVNGTLINTQNPPYPQVQYIVSNRWTPPAEGTYTLEIIARNTNDNTKTSTIHLKAQSGIIPVATKIRSEETRAAPTRAPIGEEIACLNDADLVADVTIPDGTKIDPGAIFNKTWRIKNTGTCNWETGYYYDNINDLTLGGSRKDLSPLTTGREVDITLPMRAPNTGGTYRSDWRLFDAAGRPFGPVFRAEIVVPPTCEAPKIALFEANPTEITVGQNSTLRWEVIGAITLSLQPGPQLTGATGAVTVSPNNTTLYILEAKTGDCVDRQEVTVTVKAAFNKPAAPSNLRVKEIAQTTLTLSWADNSNNETGFKLFNADTNQQVFTYSANATEGTVTGLTCNMTYRWQLYAFNNQGSSEVSNITTVITNACN